MQKTLVALALIFSVSFATLADFTVTSAGSATAGYSVLGRTSEGLGTYIVNIGDFNNDGFNDYAVAGSGSTRTYVVLGKASPGRTAQLDLTGVATTEAIVITLSANTVSGLAAGDINGDGTPDLVILNAAGGEAHVVYGKSTSTWTAAPATITNPLTLTVGTGLVNDQGFRITLDGTSGFSVAVGDFAHDNKADVIIGQSTAGSGTGNVCVIYGKANAAAVASGAQASTTTARGDSGVDCTTQAKLNTIGGTGANIFDGILYNGPASGGVGTVVAAGQDLSGDGYEDLFIGSSSATAYIVYGAANAVANAAPTTATAVALGTATLTEVTPITLPTAGAIVSAAFLGNWNADSNINRNELALGAPGEASNKGIVYVIVGQAAKFAAAITLSSMPATTGFAITGPTTNGFFGNSVAGGQDINKDGTPDLVVGAPLTTTARAVVTTQGKVHVIYGRAANTAAVDLGTTALTSATGITITGIAGSGFGVTVAVSPDINKDAIADVLVGAPDAESGKGVVYELRGQAIDATTKSGFRLHASLLVLASFFVALMF